MSRDLTGYKVLHLGGRKAVPSANRFRNLLQLNEFTRNAFFKNQRRFDPKGVMFQNSTNVEKIVMETRTK